jgi:hypothetical protein
VFDDWMVKRVTNLGGGGVQTALLKYYDGEDEEVLSKFWSGNPTGRSAVDKSKSPGFEGTSCRHLRGRNEIQAEMAEIQIVGRRENQMLAAANCVPLGTVIMYQTGDCFGLSSRKPLRVEIRPQLLNA